MSEADAVGASSASGGGAMFRNDSASTCGRSSFRALVYVETPARHRQSLAFGIWVAARGADDQMSGARLSLSTMYIVPNMASEGSEQHGGGRTRAELHWVLRARNWRKHTEFSQALVPSPSSAADRLADELQLKVRSQNNDTRSECAPSTPMLEWPHLRCAWPSDRNRRSTFKAPRERR